ncbi:MAG: hypothetical protein IKP68_04070 [Clostridia bacterium]|nr:hypothetical protein [Clostridia bacterium]
MSNEKKLKAEELSDEQLNEAAGGSAPTAGDPAKKLKKCANPNCSNTLPYDDPSDLCPNCKGSSSGGSSSPHGFRIFKEPFDRK